MRTKRLLGPVVTAAVALLAVAVAPAAAQGADSVTEEIIWGVNNNLLAIAVPVTLLVEGILFYTVWRFRKSDEAEPTKENRRLEITWTVTTALVLLFVGFTAYGAMANDNVITTRQDAVEAIQSGDAAVVDVYAYQWNWEFSYPDGPKNETTLVVPADRTVVLRLHSRDVIHSFHAPELALKQDAFPGHTTYLKTKITETGTYQLYCAEYCGAGHSKMLAEIQVVSPEKYDQWVEDPGNTSLP